MSEIQGIQPPDTQPDQAIPLPSIPEPPLALSKSLSLSPVSFSDVDHILNRLSAILSTPSGSDNLLGTVGYTTLFISQLLTCVGTHKLQRRRYLLRVVPWLPLNAHFVSDPYAAYLVALPSLRLASRLKALSTLISDFRTFMRLWGLLAIYKWARSLLVRPPKDAVLNRIEWAQVGVNTVYQVLENGAYLSSHGIIGWSQTMQNKACLWSSRMWAAHVGLELGRLGYEISRANRSGHDKDRVVRGNKELQSATGGGDVKDEELDLDRWLRDVTVNMVWVPLTIHHSLEGGAMHEMVVALLGSLAGMMTTRHLWSKS